MTVSVEINAEIPSGAPDNVGRTVTEDCRTLKFEKVGFEAVEALEECLTELSAA